MNYRHTIEYKLLDNWNQLNESDRLLVDKAFDACNRAYAPYSKFHVGAAVLLDNGVIVEGNNQENVAYPSGLCAERVALFYAGANYPTSKVDTICIVAKGDLLPIENLLTPCGACRQVMIETENRQKKAFRTILVSQNNKVMIFETALDLLPFAFGVI